MCLTVTSGYEIDRRMNIQPSHVSSLFYVCQCLVISLVFSSPVTIGTIFAIDKQFFEDIGSMDEGMQLWGGENIDLPVRVGTTKHTYMSVLIIWGGGNAT